MPDELLKDIVEIFNSIQSNVNKVIDEKISVSDKTNIINEIEFDALLLKDLINDYKKIKRLT